MRWMKPLGVMLGITVLAGCAVSFYKRSPKDVTKIEQLGEELKALEEAKADLENRLKDVIRDKQVKLEMTDRGLVITFVAEVLFDSGKAELRSRSRPILEQVAQVITQRLADREIGIEGHTDNEPIQVSGWKSNWELSTARATSVLHELEQQDVRPEQLSAIGYGEFRPVASNAGPEGRQQNRRVEIVILPTSQKVRDYGAIEPQSPKEVAPVQLPAQQESGEQYLK